jgi:hypothetical protein
MRRNPAGRKKPGLDRRLATQPHGSALGAQLAPDDTILSVSFGM